MSTNSSTNVDNRKLEERMLTRPLDKGWKTTAVECVGGGCGVAVGRYFHRRMKKTGKTFVSIKYISYLCSHEITSRHSSVGYSITLTWWGSLVRIQVSTLIPFLFNVGLSRRFCVAGFFYGCPQTPTTVSPNPFFSVQKSFSCF